MATTNATKLTLQQISDFEKNITDQRARLESIEKEMNRILNGGFLWDDPVAQDFRRQYDEGLQPLHKTLVPAMHAYQNFLSGLRQKTQPYTQI